MKILTKKQLKVIKDKSYHRGFYEALQLPKSIEELAKQKRG